MTCTSFKDTFRANVTVTFQNWEIHSEMHWQSKASSKVKPNGVWNFAKPIRPDRYDRSYPCSRKVHNIISSLNENFLVAHSYWLLDLLRRWSDKGSRVFCLFNSLVGLGRRDVEILSTNSPFMRGRMASGQLDFFYVMFIWIIPFCICPAPLTCVL